MTGQLVCRPEQDLPVAVLRVSGVLDLITSDALRHAVIRSLSAQPEMLLIDVTGLEVTNPLGLAALSNIVSQTAEWPAVPIVLCGAGSTTAAAIAASGVCADVGASENCGQALEEAADEPEPKRIRLRLRPVPDACRQLRQVVNQACAAWHRREVAATAALVATELVANVVRHAHTTMEFTVGLRDGRISMAVRDGSRHLPHPTESGIRDAGGRGLGLVRDLTDSWGVLPVFDGKVVWTKLTVSGYQ